MNIKLKTLILTMVIVFIISIMMDSKSSIQQTFSLITFIMIFHFYLSQHYNNILDIQNSFVKNCADKFKVGGSDDASNRPPQKEDFDDGSWYTKVEGQEENDTGSGKLEYSAIPKTFNETSFKVEDDRLQQQLWRFKPQKSTQAQRKMLGNLKKFKDYYDDELRYDESRVWWEDTQQSNSLLGGFRLCQ